MNPMAVALANDRLWKKHPELKGRQLTMGPEDSAYRKEWMDEYRKAQEEAAPPPPKVLPTPAAAPPPTVATSPVQVCPLVAAMTHEQKMEAAIERASLPPAVREAIGDVKTLVASMVIAGGVLSLIAMTGYGAVVEAIGAALLVVGAAMSGYQIGSGLNHIVDFVQQTRCDAAKTQADLDKAAKSFADGVANMGVGGLNLLLSLLGARGKTPTGKPIKPAPEPTVDLHHGSKDSSLLKGGKFDPEYANQKGYTYTAKDPEVAAEALAHHAKMGQAPNPALIKSSIPKSEFDALVKSGDIGIRKYKGFDGKLDTEEIVLKTPKALEAFNKYSN